ncbi:hypothetical protein [Bernardetia sp.]|uniref:hypothetical protein n=1 Tax=Bernardetia sp. TaxID=1937974 RepID=UPI0025C48D88|nr:hypothetical protein [Bernardetia sp.]
MRKQKIENKSNNKKHICFVSVGHISSNPRLIKEATTASQNGYQVSVVGLQTLKKLVPFDKELVHQNPSWEVFVYPFYKKKMGYLLGTGFHHIAKKIPHLANRSVVGKLSLSTPLWLPLYYFLRSIKADLYIVHNINMLPVVAHIAKKNKAKLGFDIEDAYSVTSKNKDENIVELEKKYLPKADYITCASPLYIDFYNQLYPNLPTIVPILNVFEDMEEVDKVYKDRTNSNNLSLYWFSQTTGKGRGIEQIIEALNRLDRDDIELHLRGEASEEVKNHVLSLATSKKVRENIYFHSLVSNQELVFRTAEHDVGLALETGFSINNELAISNKIFQYLNTGLAILSSSTKGQAWLLKQNENIGFLVNIQSIEEVVQKIEILADSKKNKTEMLENMKKASKNASKTKYNWNIEGQKFLDILEKTLS